MQIPRRKIFNSIAIIVSIIFLTFIFIKLSDKTNKDKPFESLNIDVDDVEGIPENKNTEIDGAKSVQETKKIDEVQNILDSQKTNEAGEPQKNELVNEIGKNSVCGNQICEINETKANCPIDCDETTCRDTYKITEEGCIKNGWKKMYFDVAGIKRELLWKAPSAKAQFWPQGAIITLHGGEGADSNFCYPVPRETNHFLTEILRGVPAADFGELAVKEGFAVFSLNSTYNRASDANGRTIGKRWDSLKQDNKENIDLLFIEKMINEVIPNLRPAKSNIKIFLTGISNGAFMTTLAATHYSDKVTAFAAVSGGDPYGTYFDMGATHLIERSCAPGSFRDLETKKDVKDADSCLSKSYPSEKIWPKQKRKISFKQFNHKGDAGIHFSCSEKARNNLIKNGYSDAGAYVVETKKLRRTLEDHFWQSEYNAPMLEFFKNQ